MLGRAFCLIWSVDVMGGFEVECLSICGFVVLPRD